MESRNINIPLVVIVGPTASGKTALAVQLAKQFDGEIICADSRTVYRRMDIGTAKPTAQEQLEVPHWGLDLCDPGERFSASDFKEYANRVIADIKLRGKVPFLVGGTGLYVDSVIFDYEFGGEVDENLRRKLDALSVQALQEYCSNNNISLPVNSKNKRHLVRAIERKNISPKRKDAPLDNTIVVGIATNKEILRTRIEFRTEQLFKHGVVEEAIMLGKKYGWESEAMTGNIYPLVRSYLSDQISIIELKEKFSTSDWRLAKRQMTWLRRNAYIQWHSLENAYLYLTAQLAKIDGACYDGNKKVIPTKT